MKKIIFWSLLILSFLIRIFAIFPPKPSVDTAAYAIQGWHITKGIYPLFYYGQTFMGTGGAFLIALFYKLLGVSYTTLHLFGWFMSSIALILSAVLARKLFNYQIAILTLLMIVIPTPYQFFRQVEARPDYGLSFILIPLLLLLLYKIIIEKKSALYYGLAGFVSGFALYNNLLTSTAVLTSWIFGFIYLRQYIDSKKISAYSIAFLSGLSPLIYANFKMDFFLLKMSSLDDISFLPEKIKNLFVIALPFFYGLEKEAASGEFTPLQIIFLCWIIFSFICYFYLVLKNNSKYSLGLRISGCYLFLHIFISLITFFGRRFAATHYPTAYLEVLYYPVAFLMPVASVCLIMKKNNLLKALLILPLCIFTFNNFTSIQSLIKKSVSYYNSEYKIDPAKIYSDDNFYNTMQKEKISDGYFDGPFKNYHVLRYRDSLTIANSYEEVYLPAATKVDAAERIFWSGNFYTDLERVFRSLNINYDSSLRSKKGLKKFFYNFSLKEYCQTEVIENYELNSSKNSIDLLFMKDNLIQSRWSTRDIQNTGDSFTINFEEPTDVYKLDMILYDYKSGPNNFKIIYSKDNMSFEQLYKFSNHPGMACFSVYHPFIKITKPRLELILNLEQVKSLSISVTGPGRFPLAISEIYLHRKRAVFSKEIFEDEIKSIIEYIQGRGNNFNIIADYWFSAYFFQQGYAVDFIPNRFVNNYGIENSCLSEYVSINISEQNSIIIVNNSFRDKTKELLAKENIQYREKRYTFYSILEITSGKDGNSLYWNGLTLMGAARESGEILLSDISDRYRSTEYNFENILKLSAFQAESENLSYKFVFEISRLEKIEKNYFMFLHFCDENGKIIFQGDYLMQNVDGGSKNWPLNKKVLLQRKVDIPPGIMKNIQSIKAGLWDLEEKRNLLINNQEAEKNYFIVEVIK